MTKPPSPTENCKKQSDDTKTPPKDSITQRLPTDLRRSIEVTTAIQLVCLNLLPGSQPSHLPTKMCNQKDTQKYFVIFVSLPGTCKAYNMWTKNILHLISRYNCLQNNFLVTFRTEIFIRYIIFNNIVSDKLLFMKMIIWLLKRNRTVSLEK